MKNTQERLVAMFTPNLSAEEFEKNIETFLNRLKEVRKKKRKDYSINGDILHYFREDSLESGKSMSEVLIDLASKHVSSVRKIARSKFPENFSDEYLEEKIGDTINYLLILLEMVKAMKKSKEVEF